MVFDRKGILYKGRPDVEELKLKFCVMKIQRLRPGESLKGCRRIHRPQCG